MAEQTQSQLQELCNAYKLTAIYSEELLGIAKNTNNMMRNRIVELENQVKEMTAAAEAAKAAAVKVEPVTSTEGALEPVVAK